VYETLGVSRHPRLSPGLDRRQARNRLTRSRDDHLRAARDSSQKLREVGLGLVDIYRFWLGRGIPIMDLVHTLIYL
jgi:hypothetical protein